MKEQFHIKFVHGLSSDGVGRDLRREESEKRSHSALVSHRRRRKSQTRASTSQSPRSSSNSDPSEVSQSQDSRQNCDSPYSLTSSTPPILATGACGIDATWTKQNVDLSKAFNQQESSEVDNEEKVQGLLREYGHIFEDIEQRCEETLSATQPDNSHHHQPRRCTARASKTPCCFEFSGPEDLAALDMNIAPEVIQIIMRAAEGQTSNIDTAAFVKILENSYPDYQFPFSMEAESSPMNEGLVWAWTLSHIPSLQTFVCEIHARRLNDTAMNLRLKSLQSLQKKMSSCSPSSSTNADLIPHILYLFRAACLFGERSEAQLHASALKILMQESCDGAGRLQTLITILVNDVELATSSLQRTIFDLESWIRPELVNLWPAAQLFLPVLSRDDGTPQRRIWPPGLHKLAQEMMDLLSLAETPPPLLLTDDKVKCDLWYVWSTASSLYIMGLLVNLYTDILEGRFSPDQKFKKFVHAAMALTTLHIARENVDEAPLTGRDASDIIMNKVKALMQTVSKIPPADDHHVFAEALLWIFFHGAQYEQERQQDSLVQGSAIVSEEAEEQEGWFTRQFRIQVRLLRITSWRQMVALLQKFVYNDKMHPRAAQEFEKTLMFVQHWYHSMTAPIQ